MKSLLMTTAATFAFAAQIATASAFATFKPVIALTPISPSQVAIAGERSGCSEAAAIDGAPYFEMPTIAAEQGATGLAQVKIDLTSKGNLASEELFSSTGNPVLDRAALKSARMSRFTSEIRNCQHVAGSYLYVVGF